MDLLKETARVVNSPSADESPQLRDNMGCILPEAPVDDKNLNLALRDHISTHRVLNIKGH